MSGALAAFPCSGRVEKAGGGRLSFLHCAGAGREEPRPGLASAVGEWGQRRDVPASGRSACCGNVPGLPERRLSPQPHEADKRVLPPLLPTAMWTPDSRGAVPSRSKAATGKTSQVGGPSCLELKPPPCQDPTPLPENQVPSSRRDAFCSGQHWSGSASFPGRPPSVPCRGRGVSTDGPGA